METVTHDGRRTAYRVRGAGGDGTPEDAAGPPADAAGTSADAAGTPVLCVHGSGGTHAVWKSQLARLASDRPVAALDLSGHGESDDLATEAGQAPEAGQDTLDAYARDVLAVAEAIDAGVLVGNSLGGAVVLTALLDDDLAPRLAPDAVVLAGSGAKLAVTDDLRAWLAGDDGGFERAVEFLHGDDLLFHDPGERELSFSKAAMRECGREVVERDFLSCHTFDVRDRLGEIGAPLLALTGEHDRLTPPDYHEYLAEHVPDGRWTTIEDAAHLSMLESPAAFNDELRRFLSETKN